MTPPDLQDATLSMLGKLVAAVLGALVSLRFIVGTWQARLLMFVGGSALSYYSADVILAWVGGDANMLGLVAFLLGLLGMAILSKIYEAIQALDAKKMGSDLWDRFFGKGGA